MKTFLIKNYVTIDNDNTIGFGINEITEFNFNTASLVINIKTKEVILNDGNSKVIISEIPLMRMIKIKELSSIVIAEVLDNGTFGNIVEISA